MSGQDISPGSVITLTDGRQATVRFVGSTHFAAGEWIGVELTDATGKNDGAVQGERYFDCEAGHGMFIRPTAVSAVLPQAPRESKQRTRAGTNATTGRPSISTAAKKPPGVPPSAAKRQSVNGSTPTPAPKMGARSSLRVCNGLEWLVAQVLTGLSCFSPPPSPQQNSCPRAPLLALRWVLRVLPPWHLIDPDQHLPPDPQSAHPRPQQPPDPHALLFPAQPEHRDRALRPMCLHLDCRNDPPYARLPPQKHQMERPEQANHQKSPRISSPWMPRMDRKIQK